MSELKHITILTGAGISAESGIPVFRSETGLWEQHRVEDVATYEGFARNPELVHAFYNKMRSGLSAVEPNVAHNALVKLAAKWPQVSAGGSCTLITQNIDDLHERAFYKDEAGIFHAGRKTLPPIHMHGLLLSARCEHCGRSFSWMEDTDEHTKCPYCGVDAVRPDIVWFGEMPLFMDEIETILRKTELFVAIGTSGVVYPAAGFAALAHRSGAFNIEVNLQKSVVASGFDAGVYGPATKTVPELVDNLLATGDLSFLPST